MRFRTAEAPRISCCWESDLLASSDLARFGLYCIPVAGSEKQSQRCSLTIDHVLQFAYPTPLEQKSRLGCRQQRSSRRFLQVADFCVHHCREHVAAVERGVQVHCQLVMDLFDTSFHPFLDLAQCGTECAQLGCEAEQGDVGALPLDAECVKDRGGLCQYIDDLDG
jgi:hypothetical protein